MFLWTGPRSPVCSRLILCGSSAARSVSHNDLVKCGRAYGDRRHAEELLRLLKTR